MLLSILPDTRKEASLVSPSKAVKQQAKQRMTPSAENSKQFSPYDMAFTNFTHVIEDEFDNMGFINSKLIPISYLKNNTRTFFNYRAYNIGGYDTASTYIEADTLCQSDNEDGISSKNISAMFCSLFQNSKIKFFIIKEEVDDESDCKYREIFLALNKEGKETVFYSDFNHGYRNIKDIPAGVKCVEERATIIAEISMYDIDYNKGKPPFILIKSQINIFTTFNLITKQNYDKRGTIFPYFFSPFDVTIICTGDREKTALGFYKYLNKDYSVLLDNRKYVSFPDKFNTACIFGSPIIIMVTPSKQDHIFVKDIENQKISVYFRGEMSVNKMALRELLKKLRRMPRWKYKPNR